MANFFIIRNKEKNMYYWGDGSWTKSKDCAKKYQHKDCAEILMQIDRLDYKICEVIEIPSIADLEAKLGESESESDARYRAWQEEIRECDRLREQLAEKEKEYKFKLKEMDNEYKKEFKTFEEDCKHLYKTETKKAIDELEKVKTDAEKLFNLDECNLALAIVLSKINQQINDLRSK